MDDQAMTSEHPADDFERSAFYPGEDARPEWAHPDRYPRAHNISAGFFYPKVIRPTQPVPPEHLTVRIDGIEDSTAVARWNLLWEAAQFRRRFFDIDELPRQMRVVADRGDHNVVFVPRTRSRYHEYSLLYHLLPERTLRRYGLPLIRSANWPFLVDSPDVDRFLRPDFADRLSQAWGSYVWRDLIGTSPISGFSRSDPIRLLAHNLDFWLPYTNGVAEDILRAAPFVDDDNSEFPATLADGSTLAGATAGAARMGIELWYGESEARDASDAVLEMADSKGSLRGILDAVRSNRVEEDFSPRWTHAREDFERKLYKKRNKVAVRFVELTDTIPVQGPEAEVVGNTVTTDFLALLDPKERQIVVLLSSGTTRLTEIADAMGYANHSPISKRLARIRLQAQEFFDQCD